MSVFNKLKGALWTPGVNGCGVCSALNILVPYHSTFREACELHDLCYDLGGIEKDRKRVDDKFFNNMMNKSPWYRPDRMVFAILYYINVRLFGWLFFKYNDKNKS